MKMSRPKTMLQGAVQMARKKVLMDVNQALLKRNRGNLAASKPAAKPDKC